MTDALKKKHFMDQTYHKYKLSLDCNFAQQ